MVNKKQIRSVESANSAYPWYEVKISNGEPEITADKDGGQSGTVTGRASVPDFVDLPSPSKRPMSKDAVYAVTTDGEFISYELGADLSDHGVSLRAHLAWYDSDSDEFTVLEFVE